MKKTFKEYKTGDEIATVYTENIVGLGGSFPTEIHSEFEGEDEKVSIDAMHDAVSEFLRDPDVESMLVDSRSILEKARETGAI